MPDGDLADFVRPWLEHAPKPPPRNGNSYDAFISYRSSDRAWAMALYDVLKLAGWESVLGSVQSCSRHESPNKFERGAAGVSSARRHPLVEEPHQRHQVV